TILILGLPWLYDVGAKIDIRKSELKLGVKEEGDVTTTISGPLMAISGRQRIMLCPSDPSILEKYIGWDDADLSPGDTSSDSEEDSTDSEN
ncbi:hypothetical protein E4U48_007832, partial [Claviceps purpurea]